MIHGVNILFWNIIAGWKIVRIARKKKKNNNGATFQIHYLSFRLKMLAESFLAEYKFKLKLPGRNKKKKKKGQKLSRKRSIRASLSHIPSNWVPSIFLALMLPPLEQILEQIATQHPTKSIDDIIQQAANVKTL